MEAEPHYPMECKEALAIIDELFAIEREFLDRSPEERLEARQTRSKPLVDRLYEWASIQKVLPRSSLGEALTYLQNQKPGLTMFLDDPLIPLSNNKAERAQRGVVVGRKNHYGSRSRRGTEVAAILYTLIESAKLSDVPPRDYLLAIAEKALKDPGAVLLPAEFKARFSKSTSPA